MVSYHCPRVQYLCCAFCCRQRRKERKQQRRLDRQNHQEEEGGEGQNVRKRSRREVTPSSLRLVVDCSFDNLMLIKVKSSGNAIYTEIEPEVMTLLTDNLVMSSGCPETSQTDPAVLCWEQTSLASSAGQWLLTDMKRLRHSCLMYNHSSHFSSFIWQAWEDSWSRAWMRRTKDG